MDTESLTPGQLVVRNVKIYMERARLTQTELAERLTAIGVGMERSDGATTRWHRTSIGRLLAGDRRIDVDELFALAVALETTVGALLSPRLLEITEQSSFALGAIEGRLDWESYETLLHSPLERISSEEVGLAGWPSEEGETLEWVRRPGAIRRALGDAKTRFESDHPGETIEEASAIEVLKYLESLGEEGLEDKT